MGIGKVRDHREDGRTAAVHALRESGVVRAPTVAEVDLGRLRENLEVFRSTGAEVMAVVKADAYGHGAARVAQALSDAGVRQFAVATAAEGIALRRVGLTGRILVLAAPLPEYLPAYLKHDLDVTVSSPEAADSVCAAASRGSIRAHVKVDTGMGRIGISVQDAERVVSQLEAAPGVQIAGLWTHFATADEPDPDFVYRQLQRFETIVAAVGDAAEYIHTANSAAALRIPESYDFARPLIRAGIGLYGYTELDGLADERGLKPVMRVTSRITHVKTVEPGTTVSYGRRWTADRRTRIATIGAGYADGYPRLATNRSEVGIAGNRFPTIGTICMDMFMVDLQDHEEIGPGEEVVLFGAGGPTAFELAGWAETISYEILTRVTLRVPRVYVG